MVSVTHAVVLTQQPVITDGPPGVAPLAISADGQQVYAGSGISGDLAVYQREAGTGNYNFDYTSPAAALLGITGTELLQSLAVSPDGKHLYAAYEAGDKKTALIAVLQRSGGTLSLVESISLAGSTRLSALVVSPDGAQVYAVDENTLYVYDRNTSDGRLSLRQPLTDNAGGVDGLGGAWAITVSSDGRYIYVSGAVDNAVAVFHRDTGGQPVFIAVYKDGADGVIGLVDARGLALSPDGNQLYVAAAGGNAVAVFSRDTATGLLQPFQVYRDGTGFDGLGGAFALALSPDGSQVYVLGSGEDALSVLRRDSESGALTQAVVLRQGQGLPAVGGLTKAWGVVVTSDGNQLLVTSPQDDSLAVFGVAAADLSLAMKLVTAELTAGTAIQFQLTVSNNSPDSAPSATGVLVEDQLPAGASAVSGTFGASQCDLRGEILHCAIGDLVPGGQMTATVSMKFTSAGSYINSAVAAADQRDPQPDDNRDTQALLVAESLNQAPVAEADQAVTLPDTAVDIPVLANDHDPEGGGITITILPAASQLGGALSLNGDGSVHYIPATGFHGMDTFSYTIADIEGATAQGSVEVTVNTPPDARNDVASETAGATIHIFVLVNDMDADGDSLTLAAAPSPSDKGGVVSINDDGTVSYTAAGGFSGEDSFTYTVNDGYGGSDTAQVKVAVSTVSAQGSSGSPLDKPSDQAKQNGGGSVGLGELLLLALIALAGRRRSLMASGA